MEEQKRQLIEHMIQQLPTGICVFERDGDDAVMIAANRQYCEIVGMAEDEVLGNRLFALIERTHPNDRVRRSGHIERLLKEGEPESATYKIYNRKSGVYNWIRMDTSAGKDNCLIFNYTRVNSLVVRENMTPDLKDHHFLDSIATFPAPVVIYDLNHVGELPLVGCSDAFCHLVGLTRARVMERYPTGFSTVIEEDRQKVSEEYNASPINGNITCRIENGAGTYVWVQVSYSPFFVGESRYLYALYSDITELMERERSEVNLRHVYELVLERSRLYIWEKDFVTEDFTRIASPYANEVTDLLNGNNSYQDPLAYLYDHTDEENRRILDEMRHKCRSGIEAAGIVSYFRDGAEEQDTLSIVLRPQKDEAGNVTGAFCISQNVSEQVNNEHLKQEIVGLKTRETELLLQHSAAMGTAEFFLWDVNLEAMTITAVDSPYVESRMEIRENIPQDLSKLFRYYYDGMDEDSQRKMDEALDILQEGHESEALVRFREGSEHTLFLFEFRFTPVQSEDGSWKRAVGVSRDVTEESYRTNTYTEELHRFEMDRNESSLMRLRLNLTKNTVLETVPESLLRTRMSSDELFEWEKKSGIFTESSDDLPDRKALVRMFRHGTNVYQNVVKHIENDQVKWADLRIRMAEAPETKDVEAFIYAEDCTRNELQNRVMDTLVSDVYDFMVVINPVKGTIRHIGHPVIEDVVPLDYETVLEQESVRVIPEEYRAYFNTDFALSGIMDEIRQKGIAGRMAVMSEEGERRRKLFQFSWLDDDHDLIFGYVNDVTAEYEKELAHMEQLENALQKAEAASAAKTQFVSRISHDIRTPIGAILNLTQFAKEDMDDRGRLGEDLDQIGTSGRFLLSLINDVLDISKIDSGKIQLHKEPYGFNEYVSEIRNIMGPMAEEYGQDCVVEAEENGLVMMADRVRLNQVTLNILSNAVKYTPKGGKVVFSAKCNNNSLTIVVEDTGIGMSESFKARMFEEFVQDEDNPLRKYSAAGTGLGLPIVKRLVELMGGTVSIESEMGKGTKVEICVPVETVEEDRKNENISDHHTVHRLKRTGHILLAEDNPINVMIAKRIFEELGTEVDHAENGEEEVKLFEQNRGKYDAVFTDIQMPVMNGYEAAEKIRSMDPDIPIIAMTADAFKDAEEKAMASGMSMYITKPLDPEQIGSILESILMKNVVE